MTRLGQNITFAVVVIVLAAIGAITIEYFTRPTTPQVTSVDILDPWEIIERSDCEDNRLLLIYDEEGNVVYQWPCASISVYKYGNHTFKVTAYRCGVGVAGMRVLNVGEAFYLVDLDVQAN